MVSQKCPPTNGKIMHIHQSIMLAFPMWKFNNEKKTLIVDLVLGVQDLRITLLSPSHL
jgi:hypothetical protein